MKSSEYLTFDRYLTDVKAVFASLKKLGNLPPNLDDAEKVFFFTFASHLTFRLGFGPPLNLETSNLFVA